MVIYNYSKEKGRTGTEGANRKEIKKIEVLIMTLEEQKQAAIDNYVKKFSIDIICANSM